MPQHSAAKHKGLKSKHSPAKAPHRASHEGKASKPKGKAAAPAVPAAKSAQSKSASKGVGVTRNQPGSLSSRKAPSISVTDMCREVACEGLATSGGYCRLHYIKNWKKIQRKALILKEGKLNNYIAELVAKYPDKYIEAIRHDLANNREFSKVVHDLELDEGFDEFDSEGENVDSLIDSIKREVDDEDEVF